jgi:ABC-type nickel/cobalt efflux system permease component RcnA
VALLIGLAGIFNVARGPRFNAFRSVDVLQLVAAGMCFGVALVWVVRALRGDPS